MAEATRWDIKPRDLSAPVVEERTSVSPPPVKLVERLKEARDGPSPVHRLGGVTEVSDKTREPVVAGCLSAKGGEDFSLGYGSQVEGMARDTKSHHDSVGDPFVTSRAKGGEEGLVEVGRHTGRRRLDVRAGGAHARDEGASGVGFVGHTFREVGHPGKASSGVGHTGVRGNRPVELLGPRSRVHVDVSACEFDFVAHTERAAAEERLADLVPEFLAEGPSHHLAWVDLLS